MVAVLMALAVAACNGSPAPDIAVAPARPPVEGATALFAGGCFWCVEHDFAKIDGVVDAVSGYAGGARQNPTYENHDGHLEVVQVTYDPARITYAALVERYWRLIDPTDGGGQFCDRGPSYRPALFPATAEERQIAEASKAALTASGVLPGPVAVEILPAAQFWLAEEYHQDYAEKNPVRYRFYRNGCGRDRRVAEVWQRASASGERQP
jgi:peptide-methionine (S)-S-oxide reductase